MTVALSEPRTKKRFGQAPVFIDLFAGCGGLSLGLELAGFEPIFVNELNRDAMESYLVNRRRTYPNLDSNKAYDITELTRREGELDALALRFRSQRGIPDVHVIVGGPPCQGFSGIGHRRTFTELQKADIPSNHLYREMAKVIRVIRPRAFLFENVKGLLSSRWNAHGEPGEIWRDVLRTFQSLDNYEIRHAVVYAKAYGVPQNRPRVLLIGVRRDLGWTPSPALPADGLLPAPEGTPPDPVDLLGDLVDDQYASKAATVTYPTGATPFSEWFRRDPLTHQVAGAGDTLTEQEYSKHDPRIVRKFRFMIRHGGRIRPEDRTKKFAQRLLPRRWNTVLGPTITATSLPDDYVHFAQPRILTVREWARLQTFPDWYQFAGKRTTGGRRRAGDPAAGDWSREVPKYTQIGNAVPVWLARAVGRQLIDLVQ